MVLTSLVLTSLVPNTKTFCLRSVYVRFTFCLRSNLLSIYIQSTFCLRSVYVLFAFCLSSVYAPSTLRLRSVYVPSSFRLRSVYVPSTFRLRSVYVPSTFYRRAIKCLTHDCVANTRDNISTRQLQSMRSTQPSKLTRSEITFGICQSQCGHGRTLAKSCIAPTSVYVPPTFRIRSVFVLSTVHQMPYSRDCASSKTKWIARGQCDWVRFLQRAQTTELLRRTGHRSINRKNTPKHNLSSSRNKCSHVHAVVLMV